MKHIKIIDTNKTLLMFNKGGSTLLSLTLKSFCDWKGIEITDELGDGDVVAVVRNPINRFYSGFLHHLSWKKNLLEKWETDYDWETKPNPQLIDELWQFLTYCKDSESRGDIDLHYGRQSFILESEGVYSGRKIKFHQIEFIHPQIEEAGMIKDISSNLDFHSQLPLIQPNTLTNYLGLIGDLGLEFEGWDSHFFIGTYHLFKKGLDGGHHRGDSIRLKIKVNTHYPEIGEEIKKWVERDTQILGYNTQSANERQTNI